MSSPFIWAGNYAKSLKALLNLNDSVYILQGTVDPTSVAQNAPQGSIYLRTGAGGGTMYQKQDAGTTTNWTVFGSSSPFNADKILVDVAGNVVTSSGNVILQS